MLLGRKVKLPALSHPLGPCILETTAAAPLGSASQDTATLDQPLHHHLGGPESRPILYLGPSSLKSQGHCAEP